MRFANISGCIFLAALAATMMQFALMALHQHPDNVHAPLAGPHSIAVAPTDVHEPGDVSDRTEPHASIHEQSDHHSLPDCSFCVFLFLVAGLAFVLLYARDIVPNSARFAWVFRVRKPSSALSFVPYLARGPPSEAV